jgi:hypothetical protein
MGICMYCGRDIAAYSDDRRQHHVNKCLDEYEKLYPPIPCSPQQPADSGMDTDVTGLHGNGLLSTDRVFESLKAKQAYYFVRIFFTVQVECPLCDQAVGDCMSEKARVAHLRTCGRERNVAPQHLIEMLRAWRAAVESVAKSKGVTYVVFWRDFLRCA